MHLNIEQKRHLAGSYQVRVETSIWKKNATFWIFSTCPLWLLASLFDEIWLADIASIWGSFITLSVFWRVIGNSSEMIRFLKIGAISLCALQNVSWLTASYLHRFSLNKSIEATLAHSMSGGMKFSSYALAVFYVCVFSAILSVLGSNSILKNLERWMCRTLLLLKGISKTKIKYFIITLSIIDIMLIISGVIGQRSTIVEGYAEGERPFWIVLYESLLPSQILLNSLYLVRINKHKSLNWIIVIFSILSVSYIYFTKGRSAFMFSLVACGYWYYFFLENKPKILKLALFVLILYPFITQVLLFSNFIRGVNGYSDWNTRSAVELLPEAWAKFTSSSSILQQEEESSTANMASRPLVTIPLALCLQYPDEKKTFTQGENLFNSLVWTIPGPIFPNKKDYPIQEELLYKHFKIGRDLNEDTADSLYLSAYTEFSWLGLIVYPFVMLALWWGVLFLSKRWRLRGLTSIITIAIFFQLFLIGIGESSVVTWLTALRSFVFFIFLFRIYDLFTKNIILKTRN